MPNRRANLRAAFSNWTGGFLARISFFFAGPDAPDELEVLAEVGQVFFGHRIGSTVAALMRHAGIVARTIQANFEIGPAAMTGFRSSRQARQGVFQTTIMTM